MKLNYIEANKRSAYCDKKKCNAELKLQDLATDKAIKLILCFLLNKHLKTQISIVTDKL